MRHRVTVTIDQTNDDPRDQITTVEALTNYIIEELERHDQVAFGKVGFTVDVDAGITVIEEV